MKAINNGIDEQIFNTLIQRNSKVPFYNYLGIQTIELSQGSACMELKVRPEYGNINGDVHGGLIMAIADSAMATAVRTFGDATTTIQLQINFMRPGILGEILTAKANTISRGRRMIFAEASVFCAKKEIANVKGTFFRTGNLLSQNSL